MPGKEKRKKNAKKVDTKSQCMVQCANSVVLLKMMLKVQRVGSFKSC